jgi:hypothetical protein
MDREIAEQFNQEVDSYRNALLDCARKCDWETFKAKAGRLFDYVEAIEFSELDRRFFRIFTPVLAALCLAVLALLGVDFEVHPEWLRLKHSFILAAIAASSFELYFFLDYRMYMQIKTRCYEKRRDKFIRNIEKDFRGYTFRAEGNPSKAPLAA